MTKNIFSKSLILISTLLLSNCQCRDKSPVDYVNPYMGNISHLLVPTFPTVHLPHGMLRVYPERADRTTDFIKGLPIAVTSHRGSSAFNLSFAQGETSALKPVIKYSYDNEKIKPYHYSVYLEERGIEVDFAPSFQSAIYKIGFDRPSDNNFMIVNVGNGELEAQGSGISGWQQIDDSQTKIYLYIETATKPKSIGALVEGKYIEAQSSVSGKNRAIVLDMGSEKVISARYGISFISCEQAKKNLSREIADFNLDAVADKGRDIWNATLSKIKVKGSDETQKTILYTSMYRIFERMINVSEDGNYYSPFDNKIHSDEGKAFYNDDWVWDTYRATHPLKILIAPQQQSDMINSYIRMAQQSPEGWLPTFPEVTGDSHRMNGNHAIISIWDAYNKGLRDFDLEAAYKACKGALREKSLLPWTKVPQTELDIFYDQNGFFPSLKEGQTESCAQVHSFENRQSMAVMLGDSYDSWALAQMAKELGHESDAEYFTRRAEFYKNVYNTKTAFFHPKTADGEFIEPFDYRFAGGMGARAYYGENNAWTYRWDLPHKIDSLISLMGGKQKFIDNLDETFAEPLGRSRYAFYAQIPDQTGNVGQFSMGNEPSFHIPYLYNYAGQPWKSQKRVRTLLELWFRNDLMGVPGDEDGGGMSAFVVFSQIGIYPVTPGSNVYAIGSPVFESASLQLDKGKTFTIKTKSYAPDNKYIQSAKLNGKEHNRAFLSYSDVASGGELELTMGSKPNFSWGVE